MTTNARSRRLSILALVLAVAIAPLAHADPETDARRAAIQAMYPVLLGQRDAGRVDEARALIQRAIEWEPDVARHRFTLATIEAKAGHIHSALTALEHAARLGYDDIGQLAAEATLENLREMPRYTDVAKRVRANRGGATGEATPAAGATTPQVPATPQPAADTSGPKAAGETLPIEPRLTEGGPVGLYFQTKGYVGSSKVDKVAWYFEPGGRVHSYIRLGFSPEELAADGSTDGRVRMDAGQMEIAWDDGRTRRARLEAKPDGSFWWDMGLFTRVAPLARSAAVGRWEFVTEVGVSHHENVQGGGNRRTRIIRLDLSEDGTYVQTGSLFITVDKNPDVDSQGRQESRGRWTTGPYSLTLMPDGGSSSRALAFTRDDSETPEPSDWLFHNGLLYRRLRP